MIETTISALVVAAVSGLTFVAYKHPKSYERLYIWLLVLTGAVCFCLISYSIGYDLAGATAKQFVPPEKFSDVDTALRQRALSATWVLVAEVAVVIYLTFLSLLPIILRHDSNKESS